MALEPNFSFGQIEFEQCYFGSIQCCERIARIQLDYLLEKVGRFFEFPLSLRQPCGDEKDTRAIARGLLWPFRKLDQVVSRDESPAE